MDELIALGASLKDAREARDLDLEELEKQTRIRLKYLEAIESGQFGEIDNPLQLKGFLRSYAHAVALDPDTVLAHYEQAYQAGQKSRGRRKKQTPEDVDKANLDLSAPPAGYSTTPRRVTQEMPRYSAESIKQRPAWFNWVRVGFLTMVAIGLAVGLVVGAIYGINQLTNDEDDAPPPIVTFATQSTDTISNPISPSPTTEGIVINPPDSSNTVNLNGNSAFGISFTAETRLWLEVVVDGTEVFRGILTPGTGFDQTVTESVTVKTSNAGSLLISINNDQFKLGEGRTEAEQTFTREGLVVPTQPPPATETPTAFIGPSETETLALSLTATSDTTDLEASPAPTLFFTPIETASLPPTLTPFLMVTTSIPTATLAPISPTPSATFTPTVTPTLPYTLTPSTTPTLTPTATVPVTATPFLPERETRTPNPDK